MDEMLTIHEALSRRDSSQATPVGTPYYNQLGDLITVFFATDECYSERVDELLTVFRSIGNNELVGCKLKGVSILAKNVRNIFKITSDTIECRLLLLSAAGPNPPQTYYYKLGELLGEASVPAGELQVA